MRRKGGGVPDTLIIGGGAAGLSAAYYLAKGGAAATIIDPRPRLGGVIQTEQVDGCTLEAGPDSFLAIKPAAVELIRELGLADQLIGSNDHLRITYVRRGGRLVPLPDGLMMMVPTKLMPLLTTRLLSAATKARMALELLRAPKPKAGDESVAEFVKEHYGAEAVDYLAEPLLSGVYGGDPRELSVAAVLPRFVELANRYGSLTRGVLAERAKAAARQSHGPKPPLFQTLKGGLGQMVDAVAAAIQGKIEVLQARAETVERAGAGFRVRVNGEWMEARRVILACEAHSAAALVGGLDGRLSELLGAVPYSSSMTVAVGFNAADFAHPPRGFGFLIPKAERRRLIACTWVGTKFSYRVPEDKIVARCFLGGMEDGGILNEPDDAIAAATLEELREIAGIIATPRFVHIARWPRSMAQYTVGHVERAAETQARAAAIDGLHLAGNAYSGIGVPDCIRMGRAAAEKILAK
jgi:protoporphyrinogen/coproporphyrinogen III oxidase